MDIESLLKSLNAHAVGYVVIGAAAFPVHGYSQATLDIDIFIRPTPENTRRVREALLGFGYDLSEVSEEDLLTKKILIRQCAVETDLPPFVKGVTFDEVWAKRIMDRYGNTEASFAHLDDLIRMKQAANHPKDQEDLLFLLELRRRRSA